MITAPITRSTDELRGERFAVDAISFAGRRYLSAPRRIEEIRWWIQVARAFPASSAYSIPLLEAEIERLAR